MKTPPFAQSILFVAVPLFIFSSPAWADDVQCTDIRNIDFKNMDINPHGSKLEQQFSFHNGKAQEIIEDPELTPLRQIEWEADIEKEISVNPVSDTLIRFIYIFNNHVGGTGSLDYLVGFGCFNGVLRQVFEQDGFTLHIDALTPKLVAVSLHAVYREPFTKHLSYRWDAQTSLYVLQSKRTTHDEEE